MQRDEENEIELKKTGFTVFRFWEHQVKKDIETCLNQISNHINSFNK